MSSKDFDAPRVVRPPVRVGKRPLIAEVSAGPVCEVCGGARAEAVRFALAGGVFCGPECSVLSEADRSLLWEVVRLAGPLRSLPDPVAHGAGVPLPDVRGPLDVWHPESYLVGWLVRLYGWRVVEPGLLRRCRRPVAGAASRVPPVAGVEVSSASAA
jgi:hypothetical protein